MSFFSNLFGNNKNNEQDGPNGGTDDRRLLENVEVTPGLSLPRAFLSHWPDIRKTARETIAVFADPAEALTLRQSKFGHYPCIPKGYPYPKGKDGGYLYPLAQINCSELPANDMLPAKGYLQFYVGADEMYGQTFDDAIPADFKVLFFEEAEVALPEEDMSFLDGVLATEYTAVSRPHSVVFQQQMEYVGLADYSSENNPHFNLHEITARHPSIEDELEDAAYDLFACSGHKLGGYAYFTQSDPRYDVRIRDYVLLFQMDSTEDILWGDAGVANFFIHPDDLKARNFSKVFYNWDCH